MFRLIAVAVIFSFAGSTLAATLAEKMQEFGCTSNAVWVAGDVYECPTKYGVNALFRAAYDFDMDLTDALFKVRVGMGRSIVEHINQMGDNCLDRSRQKAPICGVLSYYDGRRTQETAEGSVMVYYYSRGRRITFRKDRVIEIVR